MSIFKFSNAGGFGNFQRYNDFLAGNPTTPVVTDFGSMFPLGEFTLAATQAEITFTNIPQTYTHLQIRGIARSDRASVATSLLYARLNGDTASNYSYHALGGLGSGSGFSTGSANSTLLFASDSVTGSTATAGMFGTSVIDLLDYKNTNKFKTARVLGGMDINQSGGGNGYVGLYSGAWRNTNAVTSITLFTIGNFIAGTQFALYGVNA